MSDKGAELWNAPGELDYVMLLGTNFCGSTLLSMLLGSHPSVVTFGDTYANWGTDYSDVACTCGERMFDCPFRKELERRLHDKGFPAYSWGKSSAYPMQHIWQRLGADKRAIGLYRLLNHRLRLAVFRGFYSFNHAYLQELRDMTGATCYLDGSKSLIRLELMRAVVPSCKVIHLIRDPRGFVHSSAIKRRQHRSWRSAFRQWKHYNELAHRFRAKVGEANFLRVSFESLVRKPKETANAVLDFMGMGWIADPDQIDPRRLHVVGNGMRLSFSGIKDRSRVWEGELEADVAEQIRREALETRWFGKGESHDQTPEEGARSS